jgi:hypothetical protein
VFWIGESDSSAAAITRLDPGDPDVAEAMTAANYGLRREHSCGGFRSLSRSWPGRRTGDPSPA